MWARSVSPWHHVGGEMRQLTQTDLAGLLMDGAVVPSEGPAEFPARRLRSIFLSDIHLGTRGCQAELLLSFLARHDADTIYLVGDIIDGWRLRRSWYWPQSHNDVVQKLLRKVRKGSRVVFLPGNHDEFLRAYPGMKFGGIEVIDRLVHQTADGRRYLVLHGDQFDAIVINARWLAHVGDWAYMTMLWLNTWVNIVRRRLGKDYWSISALAKRKVKNAVNFIGRFEDILAAEARRADLDGVICGHIHHAQSRDIDGVHYLNTGDWVESCTALVEHQDGRMEIIDWAEQSAMMSREAPPLQAAPQEALQVQEAVQ